MKSVYELLAADPRFTTLYVGILLAVVVAAVVFPLAYRISENRRVAALRGSVARKGEDLGKPVFSNVPGLAGSAKLATAEPKEKVWWVGAMQPSPNVSFEVTDPALDVDARIDKRIGVQMRGEAIDAAIFPKTLQHNAAFDPDAPRPASGRRLPYFFCHNHFIVAHEAIDIFERHDLGNAQLKDVSFVEHDGVWVKERLKMLVPCNPHAGLVLAHSPKVHQSCFGLPEMLEAPMASYLFENGHVAVSASALEGPDVWIDPTFRGTFFLSDRLALALVEAGVADDFDLRWTKLVD